MKRLREMKRRRQAMAILSDIHKQTSEEKKRLVLERRLAVSLPNKFVGLS